MSRSCPVSVSSKPAGAVALQPGYVSTDDTDTEFSVDECSALNTEHVYLTSVNSSADERDVGNVDIDMRKDNHGNNSCTSAGTPLY
jgi:hypothetical protein